MLTALPPTGLPVEDSVDALRAALAEDGHAVVQAPPGAGKTTVVPLRLLDEPWLAGARIVVLEPRRVATRAAAARMADLLGERVGDTVGYQTRDERRIGPGTRVEVVTEGILTRRLQSDPALPGVGLVVFDEVHERNLHTDLALALALDARAGFRPDLRVLAMSATLDTARVAAVLGRAGSPAPVVASEGRQHPVEVRWAPVAPGKRPGPANWRALTDAVVSVTVRALRDNEGDVLVFLAGAADIRRVADQLAAQLTGGVAGGMTGGAGDVDVRPLFGALPTAEQDLALAPSPPGRRRVVVATDIAETSLTVAGVTTVVDAGQVRSPRYDPRTGLTRLQTVTTSKASADQRAGRAGRTGPGVAYRLWSRMEHGTRRPFAEPEIASVDLAGLALELAVWGAPPDQLAFLDPPPAAAMADGRALLHALGALDGDGRPTPAGRAMASLPLHPRLARMVTDAAPADGWAACALAALLEERDVLRGRPDELPVDVTERLRLITDPGARHPAADRGALAGARRRAEELARRADVLRLPVEPAGAGRLLALAYPDRVAQARGGARFRLRNGSGAWLPAGDPLAGEAFLVAVDLDGDRRRDRRIRMAAALDAADVTAAAALPVESAEAVVWDTERGDLRATTTRRVGGLVLSETAGLAAPGEAASAALLEQARASRLGVLRWTAPARALQHRVGFLRRALGDDWPDLSDDALLASVDQWLAPRLASATRRRDLEKVDLVAVLSGLLGGRRAELDQLAPTTLRTAGGRTVPIDYAPDQPTAAARLQDFYGMTTHPAVAGGRVPVLLQLLSPAGRPVQVTADLPGFWAGSYASVRKEMAGRYPKHHWPADPATTPPPASAQGSSKPNKKKKR